MRRLLPFVALPAILVLLAVPSCRLRQHAAATGTMAVDGTRMLGEATALCERFGPRPRPEAAAVAPRFEGGHDQALRYLEARFRMLGLTPMGNRDSGGYRWVAPGPNGTPDLVNVVGVRRGTKASPRYRLISAHYDTVARGCGAEDDASGVAVALEIAQQSRTQTPEDSVAFAIFDGEEDGLLGSRAFSAALETFPLGRPSAVVSLEMNGWRRGTPTLHTFRYPDVDTRHPRITPPEMIESLRAWARAAGSPLNLGDPILEPFYPALVRTVASPFGSDDGPFTARGIPAVMLATSSFTRFYPEYHRATDRPDQLSAERLAESARIVGSWALHGDPEGLDGWLWFHRLTPLMTLLAALLPTFVALRRVRPPPIAWIGAIALCGIFVAGATAAPLVGTLGMWLWPLCWGQPRGRRVALLAVSALPLVSMLLVLAAVFASYGSSVFDRESIAPLVELAVAAAGMAAMFLATQPPVEAPRQPDETSGSAST